MRLVEAGDVLFNGKLHRVVHLGGKGDVGRIQPGKCIVNGLVLLLVLCEEVSTLSKLSPSPESRRRVSSRLTSAHMAGSSVLVTVSSSLVLLV